MTFWWYHSHLKTFRRYLFLVTFAFRDTLFEPLHTFVISFFMRYLSHLRLVSIKYYASSDYANDTS